MTVSATGNPSGTADTATAKVVLVIAGGILGAFLGVVNWELVSKRWLRVGAVTS